MSNNPEPPFSEFEERYLLAEIIKQSHLHPTVLLQFIQNSRIEPAWPEIVAPFGRSLSACQTALNTLSHRIYDRTRETPSFIVQQDPADRRPKRPLSTSDTTAAATERILQPRPVTFASVNVPGQISPSADDEKPRKKRGRPSKKEHDRRVAEAEARGEVYPRPRKPKTPRASMEGQGVETVEVVGGGAPTVLMFTPNKTILAPPTSPGVSTQKHVPETTIAEGTALPAGQVSQEGRRVGEPGATAQQSMTLGPKENPMTGLRQLAAVPEGRDIQMGESEHLPSPGPVPVHAVYGSTPGNPFTGYQTHESQTQQHPLIHEQQRHEPQRHEYHGHLSHFQQVQMQDAPAQDPSKAGTTEEKREQPFADPGGNLS